MKTIAQQLNVKKFPFIIKDDNENEIYYENSDGYWRKREYDSNGYQIYFEDSSGYWEKYKYDSKGNQIYFENSSGIIVDMRPKLVIELTLDEIASKLGVDVKQLRIKE